MEICSIKSIQQEMEVWGSCATCPRLGLPGPVPSVGQGAGHGVAAQTEGGEKTEFHGFSLFCLLFLNVSVMPGVILGFGKHVSFSNWGH